MVGVVFAGGAATAIDAGGAGGSTTTEADARLTRGVTNRTKDTPMPDATSIETAATANKRQSRLGGASTGATGGAETRSGIGGASIAIVTVSETMGRVSLPSRAGC